MPKMWKVMLVFDTSGAASRRTMRGIAKYAAHFGPWIFFHHPPFYMAQTGELRQIPVKNTNPGIKQLDGIIAHIPFTKTGNQIIPSGIPAVVSPYTQEQFPGYYNFVTDDNEVGIIAAKYFVKRNFQNFAYCGYKGMSWSQKRSKAFKSYLAKKGFKVDAFEGSHINKPSNPDKVDEIGLLVEWLETLPKPLAIMACNDYRAQDLVEACKIIQLHIPQDVAILGVDNDDLLCDLTNPPLSSIIVNNEKAGYQAAQLLEQLMKGQKPSKKQIVCHPIDVVTRQSTDVFAIGDPEIASAVRFINDHAKENIRVDDVANAVSLSRRVLECRFKKAVGQSILKEIKFVRTNNISRLLIETDLSITEIALKMNFSGVEHISRYFKDVKGINLREYRKKYGR